MTTEDEVLKEIILSASLLNKEQLTRIEEIEYTKSDHSLFDLLIEQKMVTTEELLELIASHLGTEVINVENIEIEKSILTLLQPIQARMYGALPFEYEEDGSLKVALVNPLNYKIIEDLNFIFDKRIKIFVAAQTELINAIEKYYPSSSIKEIIADMKIQVNETVSTAAATLDSPLLSSVANNAPIVRFVEVVLYQAIKEKASDIHFEPFENSFKIRYRVDGVLYELPNPPKNITIPVLSRIKIMGGLDITERRLPQDGRIQMEIAGKTVDFRVSTIPTEYGESVVLRVLDKSVVNLDLNSLGIEKTLLAQIREIIELPNGILIVTGPTGCGKTTTLYSCLKELNKITTKILTAEDPVEYDLDGIIQVSINQAIGMSFARALRAFLRQDPDIIMVGEIRDLETAQMAIHASLTGHFVFSTLHTKEAVDAITRLIEMGVMPYLVSSSLIGVLGQRLVRRICRSCRTKYLPKDEELQAIGLSKNEIEDKMFYYGRGCNQCNNTGYKGQKIIVELLRISPELADLINKSSPTLSLRKKAVELGMITLRNNAITALINGESTIEEILKYT